MPAPTGAHTGVIDVRRFQHDGYALIPGIFSADEMLSVREAALESRDDQGDLLSNGRLRHVLLDQRVLDAAWQLLGGKPVYFGDSSASFGDKSFAYHKDNAPPSLTEMCPTFGPADGLGDASGLNQSNQHCVGA